MRAFISEIEHKSLCGHMCIDFMQYLLSGFQKKVKDSHLVTKSQVFTEFFLSITCSSYRSDCSCFNSVASTIPGQVLSGQKQRANKARDCAPKHRFVY